MNKDNAHLYLPLVQALADGKTLQVLDGGKWHDLEGSVIFGNIAGNYRIKPWTLTRHIPGFRPLRDGEEWHRTDWTEEMLPEGWRPLLKGEMPLQGDQYNGLMWRTWATQIHDDETGAESFNLWQRTRRPLPEPANWTIGQRVQTDAKSGSVIEYDPFSHCVKVQWDSTSSWELEKSVTRIP
jgi:hypothetical protein